MRNCGAAANPSNARTVFPHSGFASPGELVTREDLRRVLWTSDTFVDFDHSLNTAMMKLREVLGDSAEAPLYIETIPKRGYRFIAPVTEVRTAGFPESAIGELENSTNGIAGTETVASEAQSRAKPARSKIRLIGVVVFTLAAIAIGVVVLFFHRSKRYYRKGQDRSRRFHQFNWRSCF